MLLYITKSITIAGKKNNSNENKNITHPVDLILIIYNDIVESELTFDRSKYNIQFASGSFFENLGDNLILDEINLKITLQRL